MVIKKARHFSQSESGHHVLGLDAWNCRISAQPVNNLAAPVDCKILGNALKVHYNQFSNIFLSQNNLKNSLISSPLPIAVRAKVDNIYIIERPPFKTTVRLTSSRASRVTKEANALCEIWIPWTVFIFNPKSSQGYPTLEMYFNDQPLSSMDDVLSQPFTPNVHHGGQICFGETLNLYNEAVQNGNLDPNNVSEVFHFLINDYFNGGWNLDLGSGEIRRLCNYNIGLFTATPNHSTVLSERMKARKVKIKDISFRSYSNASSRYPYLTWSLLSLEEVLEAVTLYKKNIASVNERYTLSNLINSQLEKESSSETTIVDYILKKMYLIDSSSSLSWSITIKISEQTILDYLLNKDDLTQEDIKNATKSMLQSYCERAGRLLILDQSSKVMDFITKSFDEISSHIFNGNQSCNITILFEDLIKENIQTEEMISL